MEGAYILVIFIVNVLMGVTFYSTYLAFGPSSQNLRDPFEEHED